MTSKPTKSKSSSSAKPKAVKKKPIDAARATIIASILGLIGVTVGAIFTYWSVQTQVYAPIEATQTAQTFFFTQTALAQNFPPVEQASPTFEATIENLVTQTSTITPQPNVNINLPKESDLNLVSTMYVGYLDIKTPNIYSYTARVSRKQTYLWTYYWCAKHSGILDENLSQMQFSFFIDNIQIPELNFLTLKGAQTNWYCQNWTTMLSGWGAQAPTLSVVIDIPRPVTDGVTTFPIGRYGHEILVSYID